MPLLERRETCATVGIVPIVGDRGLAGAFTAQVLRRSFALMREAQAEGKEVTFFTVGKKARLDDPVPPSPARPVVDRVQRQAGLLATPRRSPMPSPTPT